MPQSVKVPLLVRNGLINFQKDLQKDELSIVPDSLEQSQFLIGLHFSRSDQMSTANYVKGSFFFK